MAHVHEQIPTLHELNPHIRVPPSLEQVVRKCMAKNPDDRYASMNDLLFALKQSLGHEVWALPTVMVASRPGCWDSRAAG